MTTSTTPLSVYQPRFVLRGISPLVWRRVLVRREMTLAHLHALLRIVFAWSDEHLHSFHIALWCRERVHLSHIQGPGLFGKPLEHRFGYPI